VTDPPAGYAFRALAAGDVDAVGAMLVADQLAADFQPTLDAAFVRQDEPVGVLIASAGDDAGWVDWLAVLAPHRGRGIGLALLRRSFAMLGARGLGRVLVNVDAENVTGATGVYERGGMRVVNRWDLWERVGR
jgi:ribosomal protein S18 acetylase RimI-like enzyme